MSILGLAEPATKNVKKAKTTKSKKHDKVCEPTATSSASADAKKVLKQMEDNGKNGDCAFC